MKGEIIAIGDELTTGRIRDSNSAFAADALFKAGHELLAISTIGDSPTAIGEMIRRATARSDFVIVTGGLGATSDDLTNEAISAALDRPTVLHRNILARLQANMPADGKHPMEKIAWLPEGAEVLKPDAPMAGHMLFISGTPVFFLPGVPHEMRELMHDQVLPRLNVQGTQSRHVLQRLFKIHGLPETEINRRLATLEKTATLSIGYYPVFPDVHLVLTAKGPEEKGLTFVFADAEKKIRQCLKTAIYATDNGSMAETVVALLTRDNATLTLAESCTGGMIAGRITDIPGASACLNGGVVAYSNALKETLLGVSPQTLLAYGAVSDETAQEMARGARRIGGATYGLAITGIAGPDGGTVEKPVGTVFIALAGPEETLSRHYRFKGTRQQIRLASCQEALNMLRLFLS